MGAKRACGRASGRKPPLKRSSLAKRLVRESLGPKMTEGRKMRTSGCEASGCGTRRSWLSARPLERRYSLGPCSSAPSALICSRRRTPAARAAWMTLAASWWCTVSKVALPRGLRMPTRLTTASQSANSWLRMRGSCTLAATSSAVASTRSCSLWFRLRVGTRTQWPARTSRVTSSVPTNPPPPSTQTITLASSWHPRAACAAGARCLLERNQQHRVAAPHLQHQHRSALGALAQFAQVRHLAAIGADDDIIGSQPRLRGGAARLDAAHQRAARIRRIRQCRTFETLVDARRSAAELDAAVGDHRRDLERLAVAHQADIDPVADAQQADGVAQLAVGLHWLAVHRGDHVAGTDAGLVGRRALDDLRHQCADRARQAERVGDIRCHGVHADAELAALHRAELDQLVHDAVRHVHRDGEADADVAAAARQNRGVDADQLAAQIDQRAAGVARIDRGVGLDEVLVAV